MSVVAAAVVGSAVVGAYSVNKSSKAASKASQQASDAQVQANRETIEFQREVFDQQREDNAPWREIGTQSLQQLQAGIESGAYTPGEFTFDFKADPGYQFRLQEGVNAINASAAARGRLNSGAQDRALARYASDLASQEYGNAFNRAVTQYGMESGRKQNQFNQLASLANVGQVANQADANARTNMANNVTQSTLATGNALAQNAINQGNAQSQAYQGYAQAANQGMQNYLLYSMMGG